MVLMKKCLLAILVMNAARGGQAAESLTNGQTIESDYDAQLNGTKKNLEDNNNTYNITKDAVNIKTTSIDNNTDASTQNTSTNPLIGSNPATITPAQDIKTNSSQEHSDTNAPIVDSSISIVAQENNAGKSLEDEQQQQQPQSELQSPTKSESHLLQQKSEQPQSSSEPSIDPLPLASPIVSPPKSNFWTDSFKNIALGTVSGMGGIAKKVMANEMKVNKAGSINSENVTSSGNPSSYTYAGYIAPSPSSSASASNGYTGNSSSTYGGGFNGYNNYNKFPLVVSPQYNPATNSQYTPAVNPQYIPSYQYNYPQSYRTGYNYIYPVNHNAYNYNYHPPPKYGYARNEYTHWNMTPPINLVNKADSSNFKTITSVPPCNNKNNNNTNSNTNFNYLRPKQNNFEIQYTDQNKIQNRILSPEKEKEQACNYLSSSIISEDPNKSYETKPLNDPKKQHEQVNSIETTIKDETFVEKLLKRKGNFSYPQLFLENFEQLPQTKKSIYSHEFSI